MEREKSGLFTGRHAINPFSGEKIPIWMASFVLMDYGTGAIMGVPAHDERDHEFATRYAIPIRSVLRLADGDGADPPFTAPDAVVMESGPFDGLQGDAARQAMARHARRKAGRAIGAVPPAGLGRLAAVTRCSSIGSTSRPVIRTKPLALSPAPSRDTWRRSLADFFLFIAAVLIFFGIMFGVLRLVLGRTVVDRVVAVDMLTIISISVIALYAHVSGRFIYLDVALVYGVLSFLSVLAVARYLERGL